MFALRVLLGVFILMPSYSWADMGYQSLVKERESFWSGIAAKIQSGDKSFCDSKSRTNMGTCARAFVLSQKIHVAQELPSISKVFLLSMSVDGKAKIMDEATILIYGAESFLKFRENMVYENPYCGDNKEVCEIERKILAKAMPVLAGTVRNAIPEIAALRKKYPASVATDSWRQQKAEYLAKNYQRVMTVPEIGGSPIARSAGSSKSPDVLQIKKEIAAELTKNAVHDSLPTFKCLKITEDQLKEEVTFIVENCLNTMTTEDTIKSCVEGKVRTLASLVVRDLPAAETANATACISKIKPHKAL